MSPSRLRRTGDLGEDIAIRYFTDKGYIILHRNYLKPWGEIDIVAQHKGIIRFVEVKSVSVHGKKEVYRPEENIHPQKLRRLHRAIESYLSEYAKRECSWQIDVLAVIMDIPNKTARVRYIECVTLE